VTAPLDVSPAAETADPDAVFAGMGAFEGRTPWQIAWIRLKRDKVALGGGVVILLLIAFALLAPVLTRIEGYGPYVFHQDLIDPTFQTPLGGFGGVSGKHWFGVEPGTGRDMFARIAYGAQVSLLIAVGATAVAVFLGAGLGTIAAYFGGAVDGLVSRTMDVILAFPYLLFALALVAVAPDFNRKLLLILIIAFISWPYIGRIIRGQALSLREREFVEAARSMGAGPWYIMFREILPNLVAPILVYSTLIIPTNILTETALSFLGVGVRPPESSWGEMMSEAADGFFQIDPMYMVVPGVAIFITVLAFNLFGDGLQDALDPRSSRR
jgi:ABC-type dipeptide/oligopeptide/nickel transport system permease subunit